MNDFEKYFSSLFTETNRNYYGVHRWKVGNTAITAVSSPGWASFTEDLKKLSSRDVFVVSPELMTATEIEREDVLPARAVIEERIDYVKNVSARMPGTTFLLGTPVFSGEGKPTNSILYLRAGDVIGMTSKRSGVTEWERNNFTFVAEEPPSLIPGSKIGVLICADLATATHYLRNEDVKERVLQLGGRDNLIGTHPHFIHPAAKTLVIPSCWGIGGNRLYSGREDPDAYYQMQLKAVSTNVLQFVPRLDQILTVDRCPDLPPGPGNFITTKPLNVMIKRK